MVRSLVVPVLFFVTVACGSTLREGDGQAGASGVAATASPVATPIPTTAPNCDVLARVPPAPAPALAVVDLGNGTRRLTSAEAGYTIVAPASWHVSAGPWSGASPQFGQAHLTSYDPATTDIRNPSMSPAFGRMMSPDIGIRMDIELWRNPKLEAADEYVKNVHIGADQRAVLPGRSVTIAGQRAYHATIQDEFRFQPATGPLEITRQTRLLWLIPVLRSDRMLVMYATPGESALRGQVEAAVATLELFPAAASALPVIHQRDAVLKQWLYDKNGAPITGRRVEAKLITYAEAQASLNSGVQLRMDRDPEEPFWLVAVSGPDLPRGHGGPMMVSPPPPITWIQYTTPATNVRYEGTGTRYSSVGAWPSDFDSVADRCH
jgi:hypothetical protein